MAFTPRGLRLVKALEEFSKKKPIYFDTMNIFSKIKFTDANEDILKATFVVDPSMCTAFDFLHGGFVSSVADIMCLYAHVTQSNGRLSFTTNLNIHFIRSVPIGDKVIAEAKTVKGGDSPIMETIMYKENGALVAKATACFINGYEHYQKQATNIIGFDVLNTENQ